MLKAMYSCIYCILTEFSPYDGGDEYNLHVAALALPSHSDRAFALEQRSSLYLNKLSYKQSIIDFCLQIAFSAIH